MIELLLIVALWISSGAVGAALQAWADEALPTSIPHGLDSYSGRFYFAILAITGPIAILIGAGSALGRIAFPTKA